MSKLITISELSKILNLVNKQNKPSNHILRYWEKVFKQIKPKKINNRRYYSLEQVETIKMIKFLLKNKGMTVSGVKNLLNLNNLYHNDKTTFDKTVIEITDVKKNLSIAEDELLELQILNDEINAQ